MNLFLLNNGSRLEMRPNSEIFPYEMLQNGQTRNFGHLFSIKKDPKSKRGEFLKLTAYIPIIIPNYQIESVLSCIKPQIWPFLAFFRLRSFWLTRVMELIRFRFMAS